MRLTGFAALLALLVAACASGPVAQHPPAQALTSYAIEGRFALRQGDRHHAGRISWSHTPASDRIMIADPFGSGVAELDRQPALTRLILADGRVEEADDPDILMQRVVGMPLPVATVGRWLAGRVAPGDAGDGVEADAAGRITLLRRDGWRLRFDYADPAPDALPARIFAERADELELRLSIERWETLP